MKSLDFDSTGEFLVTSSEDAYVRLYSVRSGEYVHARSQINFCIVYSEKRVRLQSNRQINLSLRPLTIRCRKTVATRKHGAGLVRFTHHPNAILVSSDTSAWEPGMSHLTELPLGMCLWGI